MTTRSFYHVYKNSLIPLDDTFMLSLLSETYSGQSSFELYPEFGEILLLFFVSE